jgi:4-hydroxythreonine-4-phosphate dehydrogenase
VRKAVELALAHQVEAVVTAPLSKEALHLAGYRYAGHTEILAELTGAENPTMLLVAGRMRVAHVSTHVSLREACDRVKRERVCQVIRLLHAACLRLGVTNPRIAVAGLNPHAGEAGLFGWEEEREIAPAVEEARRGGIEVDGPLPPDTVFAKAYGGMYDAVVAMYHDQGHIPVKLIGFRYDRRREQWRSVSGVNVTLGLPIVRTSVDHGTAFDLAGTGMASEESLVDAIRLAVNLCREPRTGRPREDGTSSQEKGHG